MNITQNITDITAVDDVSAAVGRAALFACGLQLVNVLLHSCYAAEILKRPQHTDDGHLLPVVWYLRNSGRYSRQVYVMTVPRPGRMLQTIQTLFVYCFIQ